MLFNLCQPSKSDHKSNIVGVDARLVWQDISSRPLKGQSGKLGEKSWAQEKVESSPNDDAKGRSEETLAKLP